MYERPISIRDFAHIRPANWSLVRQCESPISTQLSNHGLWACMGLRVSTDMGLQPIILRIAKPIAWIRPIDPSRCCSFWNAPGRNARTL